MKFTYDFAKVNGKVPMIEFLDSLSVKERAKIFTHGFVKKEQKTPNSEIARAKSIRKSWRGEK